MTDRRQEGSRPVDRGLSALASDAVADKADESLLVVGQRALRIV
jgi:hypothetical protein